MAAEQTIQYRLTVVRGVREIKMGIVLLTHVHYDAELLELVQRDLGLALTDEI